MNASINLRVALFALAVSPLAGGIGACAAEAASVAAPLAAARKLFEAGRYPEARAALTAVTTAEPRNAEAFLYLGWTTLRLNAPDEAAKFLETATALDGTRSLYFHVLGDAYGEILQRASLFAKPGWARKCLAAYDRAVALDPDDVDVREARMSYYRHAPAIAGGGMDKARAEAAEIRQRDAVRGAQAFADLCVAEKKYADAFAVIDELIARNPDSKPAQYQLGRLAAITGQQLERGAAALQEYLQHTPTGRDPALCAAHWRLGMIAAKKGDKDAARREYETALQLNPDFPVVRDALRQLR
jgi:tetratricopeptide (TPR) repeat protein